MLAIETIEWVSRNVSEMLMLLAAVGALTGLLRWRNAIRKDFIASFIVFLFFTALREVPVYLGGMVTWSADLVAFSALARCGQILGAVMFTRAALRDKCPPWAWFMVLVGAAMSAWLL